MRKSYHEVRPRLKTGDLIFFDGKGFISGLIRKATGPPTHVAIVYREEEGGRVQIIESTTLSRYTGKKGVQVNSLSERLAEQSPEESVWVAVLRQDIRDRINWDLWHSYLHASEGRRYDFLQAAGSAIGQWITFLPSLSIRTSMFCSELASGCLRESGGVPSDWDATPTPHQLALWPIYSDLFHLHGPRKPFPQPDPDPSSV